MIFLRLDSKKYSFTQHTALNFAQIITFEIKVRLFKWFGMSRSKVKLLTPIFIHPTDQMVYPKNCPRGSGFFFIHFQFSRRIQFFLYTFRCRERFGPPTLVCNLNNPIPFTKPPTLLLKNHTSLNLNANDC